MADETTRLDVLLRLGRHLPQSADIFFLLGFLAGNLDRVHFVQNLEGAPVQIHVAAGRRQIWPKPPIDAVVHGVPLPLPGMVVSALSERDDPICVQISVDDPPEQAWFDQFAVAGYEEVHRPEDTLRERVQSVRIRIDQALDVYRECRRLLDEGEGVEEAQLQFFLGLAETEIEGLTAQLNALNGRLAARRDQGGG